MAAPAALIVGLRGPTLTAGERAFLREAEPWGLILFLRNVVTPEQTARLVAEARDALGRRAPVLIDQEGGRVDRLGPPHWRPWPPPGDLAALPDGDAAEALALQYRLIAADLHALGIDVDCVPLADLVLEGADRVIGRRAFGPDPARVGRLALTVADAVKRGGVLPVVKHLPGHGRAAVDSHVALPRGAVDRATLDATDFAAFRPLADEALGMTAHVVYEAIDPERPATLSPAVIEAVRRDIGFDGCLMSDDISMGALGGPMAGRGRAALAAGCDLVLHCNADRAEMEALAGAVPRLEGRALDRARRAEAARTAPEPFDAEAGYARWRALAGAADAFV
ncbi:MAG: beta-N-acetylhexosaminidase [Paracoccaceae bacterium]